MIPNNLTIVLDEGDEGFKIWIGDRFTHYQTGWWHYQQDIEEAVHRSLYFANRNRSQRVTA